MSTHHLTLSGRSLSRDRRRAAKSRWVPLVEGLEERVVLSTAVHGFVKTDMMPHYAAVAAVKPTPAPTPAPAGHKSAPVVVHGKAPGKTGTGTVTTPAPTPAKTTTTTPADPVLVTLDLPPLDVNLLGLEVMTKEIKVTISAQPGSGELLGNILTDAANLLNLQGVSTALNSVLANVVSLANSATLGVKGVSHNGNVPTPSAGTTPVLSLHVAPVNLNLLGAIVTTSPIDLSIVAHSGPNLLLGNVVTDLANILNGQPGNATLNLDTINTALETLISQLNPMIAGVHLPSTTATTTPPPSGTQQVLSLTVPPINLNLLGLALQTDQVTVNADAQTGDGNLLGNLLHEVLNTLGATPQGLTRLNNDVNTLLTDVVGVLNASTLKLSQGVGSLTPVLQKLALPNLVNATGTATTPVLNLDIAALANDTQPPVNVNLLGLIVRTSNIHAVLNATTGDGQILGNLVYNVSHLLDPNGAAGLLAILNDLTSSATTTATTKRA